MATLLATSTKNAMCAAVETDWGTAIIVRYYTGASGPAALTDAAAGTKIGEVQLVSDWLGAPANGVAALLGSGDFTVLAPGGAPSYARVYKSDGTTCVWQADIGGSVTVNPASFTTGAPARIGTLNVRVV